MAILTFLTILSTAIVSISSSYIREKLYSPTSYYPFWQIPLLRTSGILLSDGYFMHFFKISSTSSYLNLTVTFSVLFDHYSFLYPFSWFWYLFYWIILSYFFYRSICGWQNSQVFADPKSLFVPKLEGEFDRYGIWVQNNIGLFSSFWAMHGKFNPHMFMSNSSSYHWNSLGFFFMMIWHSPMMVKVVSVLELVLWHWVGPFNLMNYVFLRL